MKLRRSSLALLSALVPAILGAQQVRHVQLATADGILEGVVSADGRVRTFKGIPFAAPPVGPLRWREPQPVAPWQGVRNAVEYGARPMQGRIFDDMVFHDPGPSEDCLYLNLWMPADTKQDKLPVMVWIFGGGFVAGSSSEPRQDAGNLSKKGVLVVSMNYRLGVFGFLAHPELTRESGHDASGNYGLLDQVAALKWVKRNIATFGGDPDNITVFGESAGSGSVSALVASPLARGLFKRAIGESGAFFSQAHPLESRAAAEEKGVKFAEAVTGSSSLSALRAMPAQALLDAALKMPRGTFRPAIDGYFLPEDCAAIYAGGRQSHVPLLAGWNKDEGSYREFFGHEEPVLANYVALARARFGARADTFLRLYSASTDAEARRAAQDFMGDQGAGFATWRWIESQRATGGAPVFRYEFDQTLPLPSGSAPDRVASAPHAGEIEYVFTVLSSKHLPWRPEDREVSELMASYWTNFAKTGDPNGPGLPPWPAYGPADGYQVMHLQGSGSAAAADAHRARYEFLELTGPGG
jgi:para-nitrobenzyl esterase